MKKYEYFEKNGLSVVYRIVPAFMSSGVRVFRKREWEREETWAFEEKVFATEEEAENELQRRLNLHVKIGTIAGYTVTNDDRYD